MIVALAAMSCGGKSKPANPPPQLPPEPAQAEKESEEKPAARPPEKPPEPEPPKAMDVSLDPPKETLKLVSPGKGKKAPLKLTPKVGAKQQIEIALDVHQHQSAPKDLGGDEDQSLPTIVLIGDAEVKGVDAAGKADYVVTVTGTDVRDASGKVPAEELEAFKKAFGDVVGLSISGSVDPNGTPSARQLHMDKATRQGVGVIAQLAEFGLPTWPLLPTDPVGVGAKWQVTRTVKLQDKFDVTYTTDYELAEHKGNTWTIKGTTKASGPDQDLGQAKVQKIGGTGDALVALADGALYPKTEAHLQTKFDAFISGKDESGQQKSGTISIELKQGTSLTPK